jgi:hypothetical protein
MARPKQCAKCGGPVYARGLCRLDYDRADYNGVLVDFPRFQRTLAEAVAAILRHRAAGLKQREIAERLGYADRACIARTLARGRAQGLVPS